MDIIKKPKTSNSAVVKKESKERVGKKWNTTEITKRKKKIWVKVVLILILVLVLAGITSFAGYYIFNYFKAKNSEGLVKYVPNQAESYVYFDKTKITGNLKNVNLMSGFLKDKKLVAPEIWDLFSNEIGIAKLNSSIIILANDINFDLFNEKIVKSGKTSFFDYQDVKINSVKLENSEFKYAKIGSLLAISNSDDALRSVIDTSLNQKKSLYFDKYFSQVNKNQVADSFVYAYLQKPNDFFNVMFGDYMNKLPNDYIDFGNNFLFFEAKQDGDEMINFKLYTDLGFEKRIDLGEKFRYLPDKAQLVYSSSNLPKIYNDLKNDAQSKNLGYLTFLNNLDKKLKVDYNLSLEKDVLKLFENNYEVIVFPSKKEKLGWSVILEVKDEDLLRTEMKAIEAGLIKYYALEKPRRKTVTLSDGTEGIELLPDESKFKFKNQKFENFDLRTLIQKEDNSNLDSFSYSLVGEKLIIASSSDILRNVLKSLENENNIIDLKVKTDGGFVYLSSVEFLRNLGLDLKGDMQAGLQDGNTIDGRLRIY